MSEITSSKPEIPNPFEQILTDCEHDPIKVQDRYENHRTNRNAQSKAKLLSPDFSGWQIDEILRKLHAQGTNAQRDNEPSFVDPRNNFTLYARPPPEIRDLVAEIQADIQDAAPAIWVTPPDSLHITVMEMASGRTEADIEAFLTHLQESGTIPDLVDYTFHHRTRLVKPILSYDASAMALSFVPAAGEETAVGNQTYCDEGDRYTYHHLRRDLFDRLTATGLLMKPRYIVPSAHVTIARFITHDGFIGEGSGPDGVPVVDQERVATLVERIEQINGKLRQKYWPQENRPLSAKGEWIVNVPKTRRTFCKGKECKKHTQHKVTQYKAGKASLFAQGKRRYDRKQSGYGGQTKPVFHKKAKTTKKIVLRLECTACKQKKQLSLKRCKHFELGGDKKTKGAALVF
ncbi:60S ribosomal protein L44 [Aspergillus nomiae NRRL 13137]|uniref:60S ribosomal protein L44 n=1 Tax=Aspergillus nomiae NRRL (strain ATCC 15546 / NRRL 13137 / CBS 260.88 / M93) TaxID=1509407 RepID=A0A0L1J2I0_ASPN3|nr:60S ribosomal protein L44 [Aspergillus nomiae NRRL 13137]KNG86011.1 60S ribosomal protein L44 [Aspergillus nomiae NRRL 13137]